MQILVVDNDPTSLFLLKEHFKMINENPFVMSSPIDALRFCDNKQFDIVITDIYMPEMSGVELIRKLKKLRYIPKIIAVSGLEYIDLNKKHINLEDSQSYGADMFLIKPVDLEKLECFVEEYLNSKELTM